MNYELAIKTIDRLGWTHGKPKGDSMIPRVKSGERLTFLKHTAYKPGDVVLCKVNGTYMVHAIKKVDATKGYLIRNNKGHENGWTKNVFAKAYREV